jgi:hypothetical protein
MAPPSVLNLPIQLNRRKKKAHVIARKEKVMQHSQDIANMMFVLRTALRMMPRISQRIILPTASLAKASIRQITTVRHNYHTHGETTLPRDDNSRLLEQQVMHGH